MQYGKGSLCLYIFMGAHLEIKVLCMIFTVLYNQKGNSIILQQHCDSARGAWCCEEEVGGLGP